ncbi:hypothetical protein CONPUDRAFT_76202 [Coniophora puteana RWD-64-598 SS2]|uniref:Uncharacterized protein n=1 Tax=Coniophora puteana (strain RWD-64-598) TaxID=741705 RepID=A0A5M3MD44_CONPW|nr:uncharacterized protein CONPUDRAFT_76202 [Coniophora puteana RWD-64-598 SS2]EIW76561.1 hypothetical protein CONPUDRAFT_76202 [Coniophora puteana RWD-64-598 SS2]
MSYAHAGRSLSPTLTDPVTLSDSSGSPPPSSAPRAPPNSPPGLNSSQTMFINARLEKDFTVNFNCGHLGMNIVGDGEVNEATVGCLSRCCVNFIADKVIEDLFSPSWRKEFKTLIAIAVSHEVNTIYEDETFATFFHSCAAEEVTRQLEAAKIRQTYQAAQRRSGPSTRALRGVSVPLEQSPLGPVESASANIVEGIELTRLGTLDPAHLPKGVIPGDGLINRNINPTMRRLVSRLPTREVTLPNRVKATYFTPPARTSGPYYWVPYGHAIGVFSGLVGYISSLHVSTIEVRSI